MIDEDNRHYDKAVISISEIKSGIWPWTSKRKAWGRCRDSLADYRLSVLGKEYNRQTKENKLEPYVVTVGYERFPNYMDITQEGEWFIFYYNGIIVTTRHKDEKVDHTIHYKHVVIKAKNQEEAKMTLQRNSKYHICSFSFEELPND